MYTHVYLKICRDSTAFKGDRYNAVSTPDETWGCARMVTRGFAAKPQESFAAIAHLGPMQERGVTHFNARGRKDLLEPWRCVQAGGGGWDLLESRRCGEKPWGSRDFQSHPGLPE